MSYQIAIIARNAAATIGRAIGSIREAEPPRLLVIDDASTDQTAEVARNAAQQNGVDLTVVRRNESRGVGVARQTAIDAVTAPIGVWLDADDMVAPNRFSDLVERIERTGADYAFDGVLMQGAGNGLKEMPPPPFLTEHSGAFLLERNWAPALTGAFRAETARRIGYLSDLRSGEDHNHLCRALLAGAQIDWSSDCSYIYTDQQGSASRALDLVEENNQRHFGSLSQASISAFLSAQGLTREERAWIQALVDLQAGRADAALDRLRLNPQTRSTEKRWGQTYRRLFLFARASCHLIAGRPQPAAEILSALNRGETDAATLNNLGVARRLQLDEAGAQRLFREALQLKPHYHDAARNLASNAERKVTLLPLRTSPVRDWYESA
ncbi:MAG: glycosyltransferase family 2 protein [Alphaproteobacteria bacterium]|nr:glycosyltransferase family 2 protein [Alphaproteobacteria bacterium]